MIHQVLVLGAGSAGLLAAISLKRKIPQLTVRVVRSPEIGVIGVGEGTTPNFPTHLFGYLGISRSQFYAAAEPTWKLGIRFLWGARSSFDITFEAQLDWRCDNLPLPNGFYCAEEFQGASLASSLMQHGKVFPRQPDGCPDIQPNHGFHIENKKLVETLEFLARSLGIEFIDGKVASSERGPQGIAAVVLEDRRRLEADFFIDASGFRSELLGKALEEPFVSFDRTLFCDRAVIGGWERTTEPIQAYTTAEAMDSGWAWQIEHEHHINRGYVYASQSISDDQAAHEFLRKNPKAPSSPRIVKFRSGCHRRLWVDNVVAIGNSGGFVEPLEATALMVVCIQCRNLVDILLQSSLAPTPKLRDVYNDITHAGWTDIRDFLGLHYKLNSVNDSPFWRHCREDTDISALDPFLEFYAENGPTAYCNYKLPRPSNAFGLEGYLVMLMGNSAPFKARHIATPAEKNTWLSRRASFDAIARSGLDVRQSLAYIRHPGWRWTAESATPPPGMV